MSAFACHKGPQDAPLPRFYLENVPQCKGMVTRIDGDEYWHMTKVLRLGTNDRVELFNGKGGSTTATILTVSKTSVELTALEDARSQPPEGASWHVYSAFAALKGGRADWLVEKCTELGARTLTPLITERSNVADKRSTRWERVVLAATKQCQRLHTMELKESVKLQDLKTQVRSSQVSLLATAGARPLVEALSSYKDVHGGLLIVGPEGDFTSREKDELISAGAVPVGLGPRRLRVETATIAILATVMMVSEVAHNNLENI